MEKVWRGVEDLDAVLHLGRTATGLDVRAKRVRDDRGEEYGYDRLLLATGGTPRRLAFGGNDVIYFRTLQDYRRLRELADSRQRFAVLGGGFIGSEIAAALSMNGRSVTLLFPENAICARLFPESLARSLNEYYREKGIDVRAGISVKGIARKGDGYALSTSDGSQLAVDGVVAGLGIVPNTELAGAAGLPVDNGIVVDEGLNAAAPEVFAAGDVASFMNPALGKRLRVEHEDNANTMGALAGKAMAGESVRYDHLPYFYSDLFDLGYEAVGELDPTAEVVTDWVEPYRKGVIYYLRKGRVRGVILWDVWGKVDDARKLIAEPGPIAPRDLAGRIGG
jgi:3-phenylpropionate/trans-cinnamate dioxygenase ferredoxin reductase subunit